MFSKFGLVISLHCLDLAMDYFPVEEVGHWLILCDRKYETVKLNIIS